MKQIILLFLILTAHIATAQTKNYFSPNFQVKVESETPHKRVYEKISSDVYYVKDFKENNLVMEGHFEGFVDIENIDAFIWYFRNRKFDFEEVELEGKIGRVTYFTDNGNKKDERLYKNGELYYIQVWNNENEPVLINGTGELKEYNSTLKENTYAIYKDSLLMNQYGIRDINSDTIFYLLDKSAEPQNGLNSFIKEISKAIKYPGLARFLGAQGRIYVGFIVNEDGSLSDFEPLSDRGLNFEKRTIKALGKLENWNPAVLNNRKVKQRFVLPVAFKLE